MPRLRAVISGWLWGVGGKGRRTPSASKFFQFKAVFGEIWQKSVLLPHTREILAIGYDDTSEWMRLWLLSEVQDSGYDAISYI